MRISGVPFAVCRPMTIPGSFGEGLGHPVGLREGAWQRCRLRPSEGFQYLGVGTADDVLLLSDEIHDIGQAGDMRCGRSRCRTRRRRDRRDRRGDRRLTHRGICAVVPFLVADGEIVPVTFDCGPTCRPGPMDRARHVRREPERCLLRPRGLRPMVGVRGARHRDRVVPRGRPPGLAATMSSTRVDDGTRLSTRRDERALREPNDVPRGLRELPRRADASPAPSRRCEGEDIGIETNVCGARTLGGLDIVPGGDREIAWTGYLVTDEGAAPSGTRPAGLDRRGRRDGGRRGGHMDRHSRSSTARTPAAGRWTPPTSTRTATASSS